MELRYRGVRYISHSSKSKRNLMFLSGQDLLTALKPSTIRFPLGKYIRQLFYRDRAKIFFHPANFWHQYKIQKLENFWQLDFHIELFKICWHLEAKLDKDSYELISNNWKKPKQIELKYRGVTYYR